MVLEHLRSRNLVPELYSGVWINEKENTATFGLWNLSGQLVGFQQYKHLASKGRCKNPSDMRYFNIAGKVGNHSKLLVFGTELLNRNQKVLFLAEGIFDVAPLHNRNINALATMTNNPVHLKSLGYYIVALCEGDNAGKKLANIADKAVYLPEGKDPADMTTEWFDNLVSKYTK